jgi:O-antigen ligase
MGARRIERSDLVAPAALVPLSALAGGAISLLDAGAGPLKVLALAAGLLAAIGTLASVRVGLVVAVWSLAVPVNVELYGVNVHPAQVMLGLFTLRGAIDVGFGRTSVPRAMGLPVLAIAFGAVLASLAGPRTGGSLFSLVDVFALPLAAGVAVAAVVDPRRDMRLLVLAVAGALTLASAAGVLQETGFTGGPLSPVEQGRVNGLFSHPNVLSGFLAPLVALVTGVAACAWRRILLAPVVLLGPVLLGVMAMIFTLSRGALAGLAAAIVAMIVTLVARRQVAAVLAVMLVVVLALFVALPRVPQTERQALAERFQRLFQPGTETGRQLAYQQAWQAIRDYPLTGVGPLTFGRLSRESSAIGDVEAGREHAHNLFLESFLSLGPLGLLGLLWMVGAAAWRYGRAARAGPRADPLVIGWAVGSIAALAAILVQGLGDFVFSNPEPLGLLMLVLGVGFTRGLVPRPAAGPAESQPRQSSISPT